MSQVMILDRWQPMTLANIWTNLPWLPSGPVALLESKDLIILLISLAVGFGRSNLLSVLKTLSTFWILGWLRYADIISLMVSSSWEAFKQSLIDESFFPGEFLYVSQFWLKSSTSSFSLLIRTPLFSTLIKSFEIQPFLVKKGLTVFQNFLLDMGLCLLQLP